MKILELVWFMREMSLKKNGKYISYNTASWDLPDIYALTLRHHVYISGEPLLAVLYTHTYTYINTYIYTYTYIL